MSNKLRLEGKPSYKQQKIPLKEGNWKNSIVNKEQKAFLKFKEFKCEMKPKLKG